jgi:Fe2+ or Zn2+ uptake regulation protein
MTDRERVLDLLASCPLPLTAAQICKALSPSRRITLASLSGTLRKMYDAKLLSRVDGYGPRGGYGYLVNYG